jgi:sulfate transport system permease protein
VRLEASEQGRISPLIKWATISLGIACFVFIVLLPVSSIFKFAFSNGIGGFIDAITTEGAKNAIYNSLLMATLATIINLFAGTLIAFALVRYRFPGASILKALIDLPIAIPASVVGLALLMLYGPKGLLGPFLTENGIQVVMALPGVLLAHVFITFPFMVRAVSVVLEKFDTNLEDAATTLGANKVQTFFKVLVPMIRGGLVAGSGLTFTRSLGEFGATLFVYGGLSELRTAPIYIYYLTEAKFDYQAASSVAIILMVMPFLLLLIMNYIVSRMEGKR